MEIKRFIGLSEDLGFAGGFHLIRLEQWKTFCYLARTKIVKLCSLKL